VQRRFLEDLRDFGRAGVGFEYVDESSMSERESRSKAVSSSVSIIELSEVSSFDLVMVLTSTR
jgi:hypothetical protein